MIEDTTMYGISTGRAFPSGANVEAISRVRSVFRVALSRASADCSVGWPGSIIWPASEGSDVSP